MLIEDGGEPVLHPGVAAFPAGVEIGHYLVNRSVDPAVFVAISAGDGATDSVTYSAIDMTFAGDDYFYKAGTHYTADRVR